MLYTCLIGIGLLALVTTLGFGQSAGDLVFIHHSCGSNWLSAGLHEALEAKPYLGHRNDIGYGTAIKPDPGRPASLGDVPGDNTNMNHWILWFNDYLGQVKVHGSGRNRIIMFKSCYPISNVSDDGTLPGDPFAAAQTLANYKAVYRHADGPGKTYKRDGHVYRPLEDVFAANPDTLFIAVTAPPRHYGPEDRTTNTESRRARAFNSWLKNEWLPAYNAAHPGLNNVAVFDWFDVLAYPDTDPRHPNRLRGEYGGESGDSHPNQAANVRTVQIFATGKDNLIDAAWKAFAAKARPAAASAPAGAARKTP